MNLEDVKRKARGLLEIAKPGSGATEVERLTARALAASIMAAHGLSEQDVPERQVERPAPPPPPAKVVIVVGGSFRFDFGFNDTTNGTTSTGNW